MAGYFGATEAPGRLLAPGGFSSRVSPQLAGFVEFGEASFRAGASELLPALVGQLRGDGALGLPYKPWTYFLAGAYGYSVPAFVSNPPKAWRESGKK